MLAMLLSGKGNGKEDNLWKPDHHPHKAIIALLSQSPCSVRMVENTTRSEQLLTLTNTEEIAKSVTEKQYLDTVRYTRESLDHEMRSRKH